MSEGRLGAEIERRGGSLDGCGGGDECIVGDEVERQCL